MTTSSDPSSAVTTRAVFSPPAWLLSPFSDTAFLLGSVGISFALYFLWQAGQITAIQISLLWVFVFHGPHFWGTLSRTYFDKSEWPERRRLFLGSLGWFLVGPVLVGLGMLVEHWTGSGDGIRLFFFAAAIWAYHHVVKQHFGFMALYRARSKEFDRREFMAHRYYLMLSLWMPAVIVLVNSAAWLTQIPFVQAIAAHDLQLVVTGSQWITTACTWTFWILQGLFGLHLLQRVISGRGINVLELALIVSAVALHWVVVRSAITDQTGDPLAAFMFVPLVTIYHNVQYHALIWHYNRTKYRAEGARERYGLASYCNANLIVYFLCGLLFTFIALGPEHYGALSAEVSSWFGYSATAPAATGGWSFDRTTTAGRLLTALFLGYAFLHYHVDSKIWHVSKDDELKRVLGFKS